MPVTSILASFGLHSKTELNKPETGGNWLKIRRACLVNHESFHTNISNSMKIYEKVNTDFSINNLFHLNISRIFCYSLLFPQMMLVILIQFYFFIC